MREAGDEMARLIQDAPFRDAQIPVYQNTTAKPATSAADLKKALIAQMTGSVRWTETIQNMVSDGATQFVETGPGKVLAGLVKRIDKTVTTETSEG
jgi:[acyl-carrier-protein] S-malonyltransferase